MKLNEELTIALLFYADDPAIIAQSEEDLVSLLIILERW
jgi:hypothetical protein